MLHKQIEENNLILYGEIYPTKYGFAKILNGEKYFVRPLRKAQAKINGYL